MLILQEHNHFYYNRPHNNYLFKVFNWKENLAIPKQLLFKNNNDAVCFKVNAIREDDTVPHITLETSYYIGLQYIPEWKLPLLVEPKIDTNEHRLDFQQMLIEALTEPKNLDHLGGLTDIDFNSEWIEVDTKHHVELTPFLVIQFLMAVKQLVRKGLKKSYYPKTENLRNRVKGKILVGPQIQQNVLRQKLTQTVCTYQEFGFDTAQNRFLKYVLQFIYKYSNQYQDAGFRVQVQELLRYNLAAFQQVGEESFKKFKGEETNPFYKLYNSAYNLGNQILQLLDFSYAKTNTQETRKYPPHWIDMSKLFELYVYKKLREQFMDDNAVLYHYTTNKQELDFLIHTDTFKAVVDAKYKPRYKNYNPTKEDARQLSGYARLNSVYKKLGLENDEMIPVYFIYPKQLQKVDDKIQKEDAVEPLKESESHIDKEPRNLLGDDSEFRSVKAYKKMYLQEVELPVIDNTTKADL